MISFARFILLAQLVIIANIIITIEAPVSPGQVSKLTREELLQLDSDVSQYYLESYEELDLRKSNQTQISYDEQLYRSIKAIRHTNVVHHLDFKYTSNETRWQSMGARVDADMCKQQLEILTKLAKRTQKLLGRNESEHQLIPLSVSNFFEGSGKTGSSILNGNFVWLGSYIGCEQAKIPATVWSQFLLPASGGTDETKGGQRKQRVDIGGRYCVVHLRARSWPQWDMHFEDRISLKRGVCMPRTCHSALYDQDNNIKRHVDYLARFDLLPPFNGQRYETQTVYCLPDEDSPYRQLDLGARLFIIFCAFWITLTLYANFKFHWRARTVQKLRDTVDIKMIINDTTHYGNEGLTKRTTRQANDSATSTMAYLEADFLGSDALHQQSASGKSDIMSTAPSSASSSGCPTPLPSDLEDADSDPNNLIEPFQLRKRKRSKAGGKRATKANVNYKYGELIAENELPQTNSRSGGRRASKPDARVSGGATASDSFDFVRDFSIESNLTWLLKPRATSTAVPSSSSSSFGAGSHVNENSKNRRGSNVVLQQQVGGGRGGCISSSQGARRASDSANEALLRELTKQQDGQQQEEKDYSVIEGGVVSSNDVDPHNQQVASSNQRVNVDILDGLKVIATIWIVLGHTMMFFFIFLTDLRFGVDRMFDLTMTMLINTLQVVGLFYVITGCLLTYIAFSRAKRRQLVNPLFWLLILIGRYIRLMPVYLLVFWFARHVAHHTGQGRDWLDYRTDEEHPRGYCSHESWWVPLSMSAADVKIPMDCVPQAWYLSDDFRTLLVLPMYVFLLAKNARLGYAAILATFVYSTLRLATILQAANIDYKILLRWHPHVYAIMVDRLHSVYTDFFVRMSTYLLGVVIGHLLYLYEMRSIKQWPSWLKLRLPIMTATSFFFGVQILSSPWVNQFLPERNQLNSAHVVWLIPLFKSSMELSLAIIILLLVTGRGFSWVRAILSSQIMKILSNISYAVFLAHVEVMYKLPITRVESNYWQLLLYSTFLITFSHLVAFFIHLLYEMPINNMTRRLLKRGAKLIS